MIRASIAEAEGTQISSLVSSTSKIDPFLRNWVLCLQPFTETFGSRQARKQITRSTCVPRVYFACGEPFLYFEPLGCVCGGLGVVLKGIVKMDFIVWLPLIYRAGRHLNTLNY